MAPPTAAAPVPVPDAEAPPEQKIASQEDLAQSTPGVAADGDQQIQVAPPSEEEPRSSARTSTSRSCRKSITKVNPVYPEMAREANVDGTVMIQALVGKDGKVQDMRVVKSIPMLDDAADDAVRQWVFKPALANNKPVAVWVGVPVRFSLH